MSSSRNWSRSAIALCLAIATLSMSSMVALAAPQAQAGPSGELSVVGEVTVNGTNAISGATVFSDSTITTSQNSSAVVSLGKLGRVELMPNSSLKLNFTDNSVSDVRVFLRNRFATTNPVLVMAVSLSKRATSVACLFGELALVEVQRVGREGVFMQRHHRQPEQGQQEEVGASTAPR